MQAVADDHVVVDHDRAQSERRDLQAMHVLVLHATTTGELLATSEVARALHECALSHVDYLSDVRARDEYLNEKTLGGLAEKVPAGDFLGVLVGHGLVPVLGSEILLPVL